MSASVTQHSQQNGHTSPKGKTEQTLTIRQQLKRVLDWKLDFYDPKWQFEYDSRYANAFLVPYRLSMGFILVAIVLASSYFEFYKHKSNITIVAPLVGWAVVGVVLSFVRYVQSNHLQLLGCLSYIGLISIYLMGSALRKEFDPTSFVLTTALLLTFTTQRIQIIQGIPLMLVPVALQIFGILFIYHEVAFYLQLGLVLIPVVAYIVASFAGYSLEKLNKFVFVYKYLMQLESQKLTAAIDRDVTLLRNIFPKNLSDELKVQMATAKAKPPRENTSTVYGLSTHTVDSHNTGEFEDQAGSASLEDGPNEIELEMPKKSRLPNPLVNIISSFKRTSSPDGYEASAYVMDDEKQDHNEDEHGEGQQDDEHYERDYNSEPEHELPRKSFAPRLPIPLVKIISSFKKGGSDSEDTASEESPRRHFPNPLVKIISSFSGREKAGWRTLDNSSPATDNENHRPSPPRSPTRASTPPMDLFDNFPPITSSPNTPVGAFPFPHDYVSTPPISTLPRPFANKPTRIHSDSAMRLSNLSLPRPPGIPGIAPSEAASATFNFTGSRALPSSSLRTSYRDRSYSVDSPSPPSSHSSPDFNPLTVSTSFQHSPLLLKQIPGISPVSATSKSRLAVLIPSISSSSVTSAVLAPQSHASTSPSEITPVYSLPPVISTKQYKSHLPSRLLTSSGRPLNTHHGPELHTFFTGAQHADGTLISLSHTYPDVTVILADVSGFTSMARDTSPTNLVDTLNTIFSLFDDIIEEYHFEKIRTIGDAYLCVANMSILVEDHESQAIKAAHQMRRAVKDIKNFQLKVGISSGSCIAGVTGKTKWNYDIVGSVYYDVTLMESLAQPGTVVVSPSVYAACKENSDLRFEKQVVSSGAECYLATTTTVYSLEVESEVFSQSSEMTEKYEDMVLFKPVMRCPKIDQLDDIDFMNKPENSEIPLNDFQYDDLGKFDYTKEDLELEVDQLENSKILLAFKKSAFEKEFLSTLLRKTYPFTAKYVLLLCLTVPFFITIDVCTTFPDPLKEGVFVAHGIKFGMMFLLFWFVHYFNEWRYAAIINGVVIFAFGLGTVLIGYMQPSQYHVQRVLMLLCTLSICMRIRRNIMIGGIIFPLTVLGSILSVFEKYSSLLFLLHLIVLGCAFITQTIIERSFRVSFMVRKVITFNEYHQRKAYHRARVLLHNILPTEIIPRLQRKGKKQIGTVADLYEEATVVFVNITNLKDIMSNLDPERAFSVYNEIITKFDEATIAYGLEKIKAVNSMYMIGAGFPRKIENHTEEAMNLVVELNKQLIIVMQESNLRVPPRLRVGIDVGPVVGGIIGRKKFSYDCWSETVNEAARLEMSGEVGCVQVSQRAYELLKTKFAFSRREHDLSDTYLCNLL